MSGTIEAIRPQPERVGRNYDLCFDPIVDWLVDSEDSALAQVSQLNPPNVIARSDSDEAIPKEIATLSAAGGSLAITTKCETRD